MTPEEKRIETRRRLRDDFEFWARTAYTIMTSTAHTRSWC